LSGEECCASLLSIFLAFYNMVVFAIISLFVMVIRPIYHTLSGQACVVQHTFHRERTRILLIGNHSNVISVSQFFAAFTILESVEKNRQVDSYLFP
jgi:hypothetical protein